MSKYYILITYSSVIYDLELVSFSWNELISSFTELNKDELVLGMLSV